MKKPERNVATALIRQNGKVLICQRPPYKGNPLKWEFVGGKTEEGESFEEALARECMEELKIEVRVGEKIISVDHEYSDIIAHIALFETEIVSGTPEMTEHVDMKWILPSEIESFDFCTADNAFIEMVKGL